MLQEKLTFGVPRSLLAFFNTVNDENDYDHSDDDQDQYDNGHTHCNRNYGVVSIGY